MSKLSKKIKYNPTHPTSCVKLLNLKSFVSVLLNLTIIKHYFLKHPLFFGVNICKLLASAPLTTYLSQPHQISQDYRVYNRVSASCTPRNKQCLL